MTWGGTLLTLLSAWLIVLALLARAAIADRKNWAPGVAPAFLIGLAVLLWPVTAVLVLAGMAAELVGDLGEWLARRTACKSGRKP